MAAFQGSVYFPPRGHGSPWFLHFHPSLFSFISDLPAPALWGRSLYPQCPSYTSPTAPTSSQAPRPLPPPPGNPTLALHLSFGSLFIYLSIYLVIYFYCTIPSHLGGSSLSDLRPVSRALLFLRPPRSCPGEGTEQCRGSAEVAPAESGLWPGSPPAAAASRPFPHLLPSAPLSFYDAPNGGEVTTDSSLVAMCVPLVFDAFFRPISMSRTAFSILEFP